MVVGVSASKSHLWTKIEISIAHEQWSGIEPKKHPGTYGPGKSSQGPFYRAQRSDSTKSAILAVITAEPIGAVQLNLQKT